MATSRPTRFVTTASAVVALTLGAAACTDESDGADPESDSTPTDSASTSEEPQVDDSWRDDYTERQLRGYEAALARWEDFERLSEPIYAEGNATPEAEELFQEYFPSPSWQNLYAELQGYEQVDAQVAAAPDTLWSRASFISENGRSVTLRQCIDYTPAVTTQNGKEVETKRSRRVPVLREIGLSKPDGYDWLVYTLDRTLGPGSKDKPCDAA